MQFVWKMSKVCLHTSKRGERSNTEEPSLLKEKKKSESWKNMIAKIIIQQKELCKNANRCYDIHGRSITKYIFF